MVRHAQCLTLQLCIESGERADQVVFYGVCLEWPDDQGSPEATAMTDAFQDALPEVGDTMPVRRARWILQPV
jgi:hypothetical protein